MRDGRALLPREGIVCTGGAAECQPARMVQLTLYTRAQCPLCHEMRAVIERVARDVPLALELIDVDTDATLAAAYGDEVPVRVPRAAPRRSSLRSPLSLPGSFASLTMITRTDS